MTVSGLVIVCKTVYDYAFNKSFIKDFATYCYREMGDLLSWGGEGKKLALVAFQKHLAEVFFGRYL